MGDDEDHVHAPPFLAHLGLDGQADERAIRKAYAQRLKRIDQAGQAQAFQDLREAYETALRWAAWQRRQIAERQAAPQPADDVLEDDAPLLTVKHGTAPPANAHNDGSSSPTVLQADGGDAVFEGPPTPDLLAEAVFGATMASRGQGFASEDEAQTALDQALADERLINLEARALFEWRVARLLAHGWQPGHEFLFGPASKTFHWEQERQALAVFGRVGAALDEAIRERLMFFGLGPLEFNAQRQLIQRLRRDDMPEAQELMRSMPALRLLVQRYPQWLRMITSQANFVRWNEAFEGIPADQRAAAQRAASRRMAESTAATAAPRGAEPPRESSMFGGVWSIIFVIFMVIRLFSALTDHKTPAPEPVSRPDWSVQRPDAPASATGFTPIFDLSPTAPVAPRSGETDLAQPSGPGATSASRKRN